MHLIGKIDDAVDNCTQAVKDNTVAVAQLAALVSAMTRDDN